MNLKMEDNYSERLKWKNFSYVIAEGCRLNRDLDCFTDVTIIAQNKKLVAHKIVLAATSNFFKLILSEVPTWIHPTVILSNIEYDDFEAVLQYMYTGEFSLHPEKLNSFLETAAYFQISSLMEVVSALLDNSSDKNGKHDDSIYQDILMPPDLLDRSHELNIKDYVTENTFTGNKIHYEGNQNMINIFENSKSDLHIEISRNEVALMCMREEIEDREYLSNVDKENVASENILQGNTLVTCPSYPIESNRLIESQLIKKRMACRSEQFEKKLEDGIKVIDGLHIVKAASEYGINRQYLRKEIQNRIKCGILPSVLGRRKEHKKPIPEETAEVDMKTNSNASNGKEMEFLVKQKARKRKKNPERMSSLTNVLCAVNAVLNGSSINKAAATFGVSKSSISRYMRRVKN